MKTLLIISTLFLSSCSFNSNDQYDELFIRIDSSIIEHQKATIHALEQQNKYLRERNALKDSALNKWEQYYELCKEVHK